jgi:hypothetical protein
VVSIKLVRLIKMCSKETYSKVHIGEYLSDMFHIQNAPQEGDSLPPLLFIFALGYAIRRAKEDQIGLKLNGTHKLLV